MGSCWKQKAKDYLWAQIGEVCGKSSKYAAEMDAIGYYNYPKNGVADSCALLCDNALLHSCTEPSYDDDPEGAKWTALSAMYEPQGKGQNAGAGCVQKVAYFKNAGAWFSDPSDFCEMDEIFFASPDYVKPSNPDGIYHTGTIVAWGYIEELGTGGFTVIEGNTNGGYVAYKYYKYDDSRIYGAGRPNWDGWEPENPEPKPEPKPSGTVTIALDVLSRGSTGGQVNTVKALLMQFGWSSNLELDGDFDWDTEQAVNTLKDRYDLPQDGIVDESVWRLLLL